MDAARRHRMPGSQAEDLITHGTARVMGFMFALIAQAPRAHSKDAFGQGGTVYTLGLSYS